MKKKKSIFRCHLELKITEIPDPLTQDNIKPGESHTIQSADDERMIVDYSPNRKVTRYSALSSLGFSILVLLSDGLPKNQGELIMMLLFIVVFVFPGLFLLYYSYKGPVARIVYDRLNGMLELPNTFWGKPYLIPFQEVEAVLGNGDSPSVGLLRPRRHWWDYIFKPPVMVGAKDVNHDLSFILWYMDRNRPLPPGNAFDPYREKDENQRRAEGYPAPLYPAFFDEVELWRNIDFGNAKTIFRYQTVRWDNDDGERK